MLHDDLWSFMAHIITLNTHTDNRGSLTVLEDGIDVDFEIKRFFYIYNVNEKSVRAGHRHHKNKQALICVKGSCIIFVNDGSKKEQFTLDSATKCLILDPADWHTMHDFTRDAILLILASEHYDVTDYIDEEY
jgi:dTDP-4-dehydrorhamnose 3,5-epimerase-like enzyme